jgi:NADPH-dependent curcumin reductase CurA
MSKPENIVPASVNRQWILTRRPVGNIADGDLILKESAIPTPADGEVLVRTTYLSLDPTNRIWMSDMDQYMEPMRVGDPMRSIAMGEVVDSRAARFKIGDVVMTLGSWSEFFTAPAASLSVPPKIPGVEPKALFGIFYLMGPTAYIGLVTLGTPKMGETLVVSAAAGAVGSLVGQIGKALGCRVVGIAGTKNKCDWVVDSLGFDAAINYKSEDVHAVLRKHCPAGVDVYFDNVGGEILNTVMGQMNLFGRIVECGLISMYNATAALPGPSNYPRILMKRLKVQGFIASDSIARFPEAYRALTHLYAAGKLKWRLHEVRGLENAANAVKLLYDGGNNGKLLVKVV